MFSMHKELVPALQGKNLTAVDEIEQQAIIADYLETSHPYYDCK